MSIWLKNEVEKLAERVTALEARFTVQQQSYVQNEVVAEPTVDISKYMIDMTEIMKRLAELEEQAHTHNFGRKKKG